MKVFVYALGYDELGLGVPRVASSLSLAKAWAQVDALRHRNELGHPDLPDYYSITECEVDGDPGTHHEALLTSTGALEWETAP